MFRAVVASVAVLACGVASSCDQAETTPAAAVASEAPAAPVMAAPALGSEVVVSLTCDVFSGNDGFTREIPLTGGNGVYTWNRGAKDTERYEFWEMKLDGGNGFTLTGEYIEGAPELKAVSFTGTVVGKVVSGEGTRGPRKCTIKS